MLEIELPGSGNWFKYISKIESREEAESIMQVAKRELKVRLGKICPQG